MSPDLCEKCKEVPPRFFIEAYHPVFGIRTYWLCKDCQIKMAEIIEKEVDP